MRDEPGPKFVFTHILLPHPPYTHAADGHFLTPEEMEGRSSRTLYVDQMTYANTRIREIMSGLLSPARGRSARSSSCRPMRAG